MQVAKDQVVDFFAGDAHGEDMGVPVGENSAVVRLRGQRRGTESERNEGGWKEGREDGDDAFLSHTLSDTLARRNVSRAYLANVKI